jgi:hypothetical protein
VSYELQRLELHAKHNLGPSEVTMVSGHSEFPQADTRWDPSDDPVPKTAAITHNIIQNGGTVRFIYLDDPNNPAANSYKEFKNQYDKRFETTNGLSDLPLKADGVSFLHPVLQFMHLRTTVGSQLLILRGISENRADEDSEPLTFAATDHELKSIEAWLSKVLGKGGDSSNNLPDQPAPDPILPPEARTQPPTDVQPSQGEGANPSDVTGPTIKPPLEEDDNRGTQDDGNEPGRKEFG